MWGCFELARRGHLCWEPLGISVKDQIRLTEMGSLTLAVGLG